MNINIIKMELQRNFRSFIVWTAAVSGMMLFGMMFYPAINSGDLLAAVGPVFETPMMAGVLSAFGADLRALSNLPGYYATYNSFYNILLGCIFASFLGGKLLAGEEGGKTADFLFTRPVSRISIFVSKTAVLIIYSFFFSVVFFASSVISMEVVSDEALRILSISRKDSVVIRKAVEEHPEEIYEAFELDDESFAELSMNYAMNLLKSRTGEAGEPELEPEVLISLLEEAAGGPEAFFESVLNEPEEYMKLFPMGGSDIGEFLEKVRSQQQEYREMKKAFFESPELFLMFFDDDPASVLRRFEPLAGSMNNAVKLLELPSGFEDRIFGKYSPARLGVFSVYVFLLLLCMGSLSVLVSLIVPRTASVTASSAGLVLVLYFLKSAAGVAAPFSAAASAIGRITPFAWIDIGLTSLYYEFEPYRLLLFLSVSSSALFGAAARLRNKDILV